MNPVLKEVDDWLLNARGIETDHGGDGNNYIGFELNRNNRYDNILLSLNDDSVLSWYVEPFIEREDIDASPHGHLLDAYLMRTNETLTLGRWSRTEAGGIPLDVSVPINGAAPPAWVLDRMCSVAVDAVDLMISRVRLFLETSVAIVDPSNKTYTECISLVADNPDALPRLEALGLVSGEAASAVRRVMGLQAPAWSPELQAQTREALEEMRVSPDGFLHFKHMKRGYGTMKLETLVAGDIVIDTLSGGTVLHFADADELLSAGWVID